MKSDFDELLDELNVVNDYKFPQSSMKSYSNNSYSNGNSNQLIKVNLISSSKFFKFQNKKH